MDRIVYSTKKILHLWFYTEIFKMCQDSLNLKLAFELKWFVSLDKFVIYHKSKLQDD